MLKLLIDDVARNRQSKVKSTDEELELLVDIPICTAAVKVFHFEM